MISEMSHLTRSGTHQKASWRIRKRGEQESKNVREAVLGSHRPGGKGAKYRVRRKMCCGAEAHDVERVEAELQE